jgi:hypothetical protein
MDRAVRLQCDIVLSIAFNPPRQRPFGMGKAAHAAHGARMLTIARAYDRAKVREFIAIS